MRLGAICSITISFSILSGIEGVNIDKPYTKNIITQLLHELRDLRDNYAELKHRQDKAEHDKVLQDKKLNHLLIELYDLKTRHDDLEKQQTQTTRELQDMQNKYSKLKHDNDKTVSEPQEMRNKYNKPLRHQDKTSAARMNVRGIAFGQQLKQRKRNPRGNLKKPGVENGSTTLRSHQRLNTALIPLLAAEDGFVGFTARLLTAPKDLGVNQTVKFDSVITNIGNVYNRTTGKFKCLSSGVYMFFTNILVYPGKWMVTEIVHNGVNVANIYSADSNYFGSGSSMAVLLIEEGETVWVRVIGASHAAGNQIDGYGYSSFSGFRIG